MKACPTCGVRLPDDAAFCPEDGTDVRAEVPPAPMVDLVGQTLDGRYRLDSRLGSGGMGVVYAGRHVVIGKPVAVKALRPEHVDQGDIRERFLQEARLAGEIHHPNVVEISDFGAVPGGGAYYVMELLKGHSLANEIDRNGKLSPRRAVQIAVQVSRGLGAAHAKGIVHRDLKPDNVFLCEDAGGERVKILDFGIARVLGRHTRITKVGSVVGTPEYMSPEQAQGGDVDQRSDLYSLGIILFEMLTGKVPFRSDSVIGTLTKQMFDPPSSLRAVDPTLPDLARTEAVVLRLLSKAREDRPTGAEEVVRLLEQGIEQDLAAGARTSKRTVAMGSGSMAGPSGPAVVAALDRGGAPSWPGVPGAAIALAAVAAPPATPAPRVPTPVPALDLPQADPARRPTGEIATPDAEIRRATRGGGRWIQLVVGGCLVSAIAGTATFAGVRFLRQGTEASPPGASTLGAADDPGASQAPAPPVATPPAPTAAVVAPPDPSAPPATAAVAPEDVPPGGAPAASPPAPNAAVPAAEPSAASSAKKAPPAPKSTRPQRTPPPPVQRPTAAPAQPAPTPTPKRGPPPDSEDGDLKNPFGSI